MSFILQNYVPPGPVAAAYLRSKADVCAILGPQGGGKTTATVRKLVLAAMNQPPSPKDGIRRRRIAVFRNTYGQLQDTTLKSWNELFPQTMGSWDASELTHTLRLGCPDGTTAILEVMFRAADRPDHIGKLKGLEVSDIWLNEAVEFDWSMAEAIMGRNNRYPSMEHGGCHQPQVFMDTNAPDIDCWFYTKFEEEKPEGFALFKQPSGLSPQAENLTNLPGGRAYYERLVRGRAEWWIKVFVHGEYAYSVNGMPVIKGYKDGVHCAATDLVPIEGRKVIVGLDADLHPAASIWQRDINGQWRGLADLYMPGADVYGFAPALKRLLEEVLGDLRRGWDIVGIGDPSSDHGTATNEVSWLQIIGKLVGMKVRRARTNHLSPRLSAWTVPMGKLLEAGEPGLIISPRMRWTRKGLAGAYRFRAIKALGAGVRYEGDPEKNDHSHPIDAGGYALLEEGGMAEVMAKDGKAGQGHNQGQAGADPYAPRNADTDYDPLSH